jgi:hypothetical protein
MIEHMAARVAADGRAKEIAEARVLNKPMPLQPDKQIPAAVEVADGMAHTVIPARLVEVAS